MFENLQKEREDARRDVKLIDIGLKALIVLAEIRMAAKDSKNYVYADKIRDMLKVIGVDIKDTKKGYIMLFQNNVRIFEVDGEKVV